MRFSPSRQVDTNTEFCFSPKFHSMHFKFEPPKKMGGDCSTFWSWSNSIYFFSLSCAFCRLAKTVKVEQGIKGREKSPPEQELSNLHMIICVTSSIIMVPVALAMWVWSHQAMCQNNWCEAQGVIGLPVLAVQVLNSREFIRMTHTVGFSPGEKMEKFHELKRPWEILRGFFFFFLTFLSFSWNF